MKHASRLLSLLVLAAAFVLLTGSICQKATPDRMWDRGDFHPVPENIESYKLPDGLTIDSLYGYDDEIPESALPLYMVIRNSKDDDIDVTFPAGLVFSPDSADYQYMMVLKEFAFTATGSGATTVILPTYCCNEDLDEPDDDAFYTIEGRENDKETEELFDLVADKSLSGDDAVLLAQDALFEITDLEGLTDSTKAQLENLP